MNYLHSRSHLHCCRRCWCWHIFLADPIPEFSLVGCSCSSSLATITNSSSWFIEAMEAPILLLRNLWMSQCWGCTKLSAPSFIFLLLLHDGCVLFLDDMVNTQCWKEKHQLLNGAGYASRNDNTIVIYLITWWVSVRMPAYTGPTGYTEDQFSWSPREL